MNTDEQRPNINTVTHQFLRLKFERSVKGYILTWNGSDTKGYYAHERTQHAFEAYQQGWLDAIADF